MAFDKARTRLARLGRGEMLSSLEELADEQRFAAQYASRDADLAQAHTLLELGCELAQGFYLGRPVDALDARARIATANGDVALAS